MNSDFVAMASILQNEYIIKTEVLFAMQKHIWIAAFAEQFQRICAEIARLYSESDAISHIEYTMLYTNFIERRYIAEVWIYGNDWYCDKNQRMIDEYDISFLFVYFNELWDKLLSSRKRYVGKVTAQEVTAFMLQVLPEFYSYLISIARFAIAGCVDKKPFTDIIKNEMFSINVGDYMAKTAPVFNVNPNSNFAV